MQHPDEGTIHAWLDGALNESESAEIEQHVGECAACAAAVAEARGLIAGASRIAAMLDNVRGGVIPTAPANPAPAKTTLWTALRVTPARAALAASLLIAAAGVLTVRHDTATKLVPTPMSPISGGAGEASIGSIPAASPAVPSAPLRSSAPSAAADVATRTAEPGAKSAVARGGAAPAPATPTPAAEKTATVVAAAPRPARIETVEEQRRSNATNVASAPATTISAPTASGAAANAAAPAVAETRADRSVPLDSAGRAKAAARVEQQPAAAAASAPRFNSSSTLRLESVVATGAFASTEPFVGCYRMNADSTAWPRGLPNSFSLAHAGEETGNARNVVRLVTPDGRVDSVVAGGSWRQLTPTTASVTFEIEPARPVLSLQLLANGALQASARVLGRPAPVSVTRMECRP